MTADPDVVEATLVDCFKELIANKRRRRRRIVVALLVAAVFIALDLAYTI